MTEEMTVRQHVYNVVRGLLIFGVLAVIGFLYWHWETTGPLLGFVIWKVLFYSFWVVVGLAGLFVLVRLKKFFWNL